MVALAAAFAVVVLASAAEWLHGKRTRRVAGLAFGPGGKPSLWARPAPLLRIGALGALAWGLVVLLQITPRIHKINEIPEHKFRHLVLVLDVSPSMKLEDAGPTGKLSRSRRAADLLKSFFERVPIEMYRISVVATYSEAKPVVVNTMDMEVVRNILTDLPMSHAFKAGKTDIFAGLNEAARIAGPFRPASTTVMLVTDGDTVPATGMPKMPDSVAHVVVVGVGDPHAGRFIEGHQSRQDASTLRQVAARLRGAYHDGNAKHLPSELLSQIAQLQGESPLKRLTLREYALLAVALGASMLAFLPFALHYLGTRWRPGRLA
jgi:Ca-activated chloride channel family protein